MWWVFWGKKIDGGVGKKKREKLLGNIDRVFEKGSSSFAGKQYEKIKNVETCGSVEDNWTGNQKTEKMIVGWGE